MSRPADVGLGAVRAIQASAERAPVSRRGPRAVPCGVPDRLIAVSMAGFRRSPLVAWASRRRAGPARVARIDRGSPGPRAAVLVFANFSVRLTVYRSQVTLRLRIAKYSNTLNRRLDCPCAETRSMRISAPYRTGHGIPPGDTPHACPSNPNTACAIAHTCPQASSTRTFVED